ncbi:MAG TPA: cation:proton antiporter [Candidatus Acidoferrales bacterium]|nr:cation:proton antiporter [Candidatus Acidoferrales bacterium]
MAYGLFLELLILLASSLVVLSLCYPLRIPPILGYILVGLLIGPGGLGWISRPESVAQLAEFGVVFLLFSLGLEFALPKMRAMRRLVLGIGLGQVALTLAVFGGIALSLGISWTTSGVLAAALALSSTAVVTRELTRNHQLHQRFGQIAVAVLLFQDLASVFFLAILPSLGGSGDAVVSSLLWTVAKSMTLLGTLLVVGPRVLPPLFSGVARTRVEELFVLAVLVVILAAAALTQLMGLSMALGAFMAGMLLGESHFRHQIEAEIRPFRDVLLGIFFVAVGMLIRPVQLVDQVQWVLLLTLGFMAIKGLLVTGLSLGMGESRRTALLAAFALAQGGEFGFALLTLGGAYGVVSSSQQSLLFASIMLSMMATPLLLKAAPQWTRRVERAPDGMAGAALLAEANKEPHVILCGFGRVGQAIARFLQREQIPYIAIDSDTLRVREALAAGESVLFGDSRQRSLLYKAGLMHARLLVIAFNNDKDAQRVLEEVRPIRPDLPVLVRTSDDRHWEALQAAGATGIVPETLESSLMLVSHVLELLGVPSDRILEHIQQARDERYRLLHGYLHGERSKLADARGNPLEVVHPVVLPETAHAVNHRLGDLGLDQIGVRVQALRRGSVTGQDPSDDVRLKANDTLVLLGTASQLERAEQRLLGG